MPCLLIIVLHEWLNDGKSVSRFGNVEIGVVVKIPFRFRLTERPYAALLKLIGCSTLTYALAL